MPRPVAFRPEMRADVLNALHAGATYRDACESAGIPWRTWCDWSKAHREREGGHPDPDVDALVADARIAYAKASTSMVAQVRVSSKKDWRAAAWLLDHRQGDPKARSDERRAKFDADVARNRARGTHVENIRNVTELTDDDLRAEAKRLLDGEGAADGSVSRSTH